MKKFSIILAIIFGCIVLTSIGLIFAVRSNGFREAIAQKTIATITNTSSKTQTSLVHQVLGFGQARTYLLLFLNNTELRPAGGFIGSYAVVRMDSGVPHLLKVEGTEILDHSVPQDIFELPPLPLQKYLKITKWQFRDSNWSPDFIISTQKALQLFKMEHGTEANAIDGVIAIDPTVVSNVLKITGPITVDGHEFTSDNFTQKLEYEVEYGYEDRGLDFKDRKQMLKDLAEVMVKKMATDVFLHWSAYTTLLPSMLDQKHVVLYSQHADEQALLAARNWTGAMSPVAGDYVLWTDANLGALKTDASLTRSLSYSIVPVGKTYQATAKMHYVHSGTFDKFTSRYRDYARLYVPVGSTFVKAEGLQGVGNIKPGQVDQGVENGRQWFGGFGTIEPKSVKDFSITFTLSPEVVKQIASGYYTLAVQKQIGTMEPQLTLNLDFGTTVVGARPGEGAAKHGDSKYQIVTELDVDKDFQVTLGK